MKHVVLSFFLAGTFLVSDVAYAMPQFDGSDIYVDDNTGDDKQDDGPVIKKTKCSSTSSSPAKTPPANITKGMPSPKTTPTFDIIEIHNFCRAMVQALAQNDLPVFKKELVDFYKHIPYTSLPSGSANQKLFFRALSWILCGCLTDQQPFLTHEGIICSPVMNNGTHNFILQFSAGDSNCPHLYTFSHAEAQDIKVLSVHFIVSQKEIKVRSVTNDGSIDIAIQDRLVTNLDYDTYFSREFFSHMIKSLDDAQETKLNFELIYNSIPAKLRVSCEKFYHGLIFCIIALYRSSFAQIEVATSKGRADLVIRSNRCDIIIEFKHNGYDAQEGLDQIGEKDYTSFFRSSFGKTCYKVGVNVRDGGQEIYVDVITKKHDPAKLSAIDWLQTK